MRNGSSFCDGSVISSIHRRHRSLEFQKFLNKINADVPDELAVPPSRPSAMTRVSTRSPTWCTPKRMPQCASRPRHPFARSWLTCAAHTDAGLAVVVVSLLQGWTPILDPIVAIGAALLGTLVGLAAGTYPAVRASNIEPITALRGGT